MNAEDAAQLLRRHRLRVTPQRRAILDAFHGAADEHLSAEEVLSRASMVVPEIGRGTVYATLAELAELGLVASVGTSEPVRYEINVAAHDHFHCRLCLRLFNVEFGGRELQTRPLPGYWWRTWPSAPTDSAPSARTTSAVWATAPRAIIERPTLERESSRAAVVPARRQPDGRSRRRRLGRRDRAHRVRGPRGLRDHRPPGQDSPRIRRRAGEGPGAWENVLGLLRWRQSPRPGRGGLEPDARRDRGAPAHRAGDPLRGAALLPPPHGRVVGLRLRAGDRGDPMPLLVPCHRVCRGSVRMEGYVGGLERLHFLQSARSPAGRRRGAPRTVRH